MNFKLIFCVCIGALALVGCSTNVGSQSINDFTRFQQLENGETDKVGVHEIFGQPHGVYYFEETDESVWNYFQVTSRMNPSTFIPYVGLVTGGNDLDIVRADFYFDQSGVLLRTQREQRSRYVNQWVGMGDALTRTGQVAVIEEEMGRLGLPFDREDAQLMTGWADADN